MTAKKKATSGKRVSAPAPSTSTLAAVPNLKEDPIRLDPAVIMLGDNVRYGLKKPRIARLKEEIVDAGGVRMPIEVLPLTDEEKAANPGKLFKTLTGNYRTVSVQELNEKDKLGLDIPAIIRRVDNVITRLKMQVAENMEREDMSTMDCAVAIDEAFKAGVSRADIRKMFPRQTAGNKLEEASNAWVNMVWRFLEFPKKIQNMIHDGKIGVAGAYEMYKKPKKDATDKEKIEIWNAIATKLEESWTKEKQAEETEEEKFLTAEKKAAEREAKANEAAKKIEDLKKAVADTEKITQDSQAALEVAKVAAKLAHEATLDSSLNKDQRKKAIEADKEASGTFKQALEVVNKNFKEYEKAVEALKKATEEPEPTPAPATTSAAPSTPATPASAPAPRTPAGPADINKAANAAGVGSTTEQPLPPVKNLKEAKDRLKSLVYLSSPATQYQKTISLYSLIEQCLDGKISDGSLQYSVAKMFGETK